MTNEGDDQGLFVDRLYTNAAHDGVSTKSLVLLPQILSSIERPPTGAAEEPAIADGTGHATEAWLQS